MDTLELARKLIDLGLIDDLSFTEGKTAQLVARDLDQLLKIDSDHSTILWGSE